jgi:hypothetical protein
MGVFDHQFGIIEETTYGTPVLPVTRFYEIFPGNGFEFEATSVRAKGIRPGRSTVSADQSVRARPNVTGAFEHEPLTKGFGLLAKMIFGSVSTGSLAAGKYPHTFTIGEPGKFTAQEVVGRLATNKPFTTTGNKVVDATFSGAVGELLTVAFNVDSRVMWGTASLAGGTTISTNTVTMASTAGVTAGMPVTGTGIPASTYVGVVVHNTSITLVTITGAVSNATATGSPTLTFGTAAATASFPSAAEPFLVDSIDVTVGGATVCAGGFELSMNPGLKTDRAKMCSNGLKDEPIRASMGECELTLSDITYADDVMVDRIIAATAAGAQVAVTIVAKGQNDPTATLTFTIPVWELDGDLPKMEEGLTEFSASGMCLSPAAGGSQVTLVYNTVDATP